MKRLNYVFAMLFVALVAIGCNGKAYQYANVITTVTTTEGTPAKGVMVYIYDETTWADRKSVV